MSVAQVKLRLPLPSLSILQLILVKIRMAENEKDDIRCDEKNTEVQWV